MESIFSLKKSTLQLLRFHFSFFLMPVYWFALSQVPDIDWLKAILIFIILHLIVYPASNGYNSYMDKDETAIGGLENPLPPTKQLFYTTVLMDMLAVALSFVISIWFVICIIAYILASRAYSFRGIRLKKYPVVGYLTVILFQGGVTYFMVHYGSSDNHRSADTNPEAILAATLLIGGFYPLTQIYQHEADKKDSVNTISSMLGYRGTFVFTALIYAIAMAVLAHLLISSFQPMQFLLLQIFFLPILVYFFIWAAKVWKDEKEANFKNTMRMNLLASACSNLGFITIFILNHHG